MRTLPILTILSIAVLAAVTMLEFPGQRFKARGEASNQPFANAVEQRLEIIAQLRSIHETLKEQNRLLTEQSKLLREHMQALTRLAPVPGRAAEKSKDHGENP